MPVQMVAPLFVKFAPSIPVPEGFDNRFTYPVFSIDVSFEEDKETTLMLLSDRQGKFAWIDAETLRRSPPENRPHQDHNNGHHKTFAANRPPVLAGSR